ncbi:MAG: 50S ribosomal protein L18 [Pseudomonadota bacterium]
MNKKDNRLRRARRTRAKIRELREMRLSVHRTPRHIYAQIIAEDGSTVVASASTVQKSVAKGLKATGNVDAAIAVGKALAKRAKDKGVERVAFDRSGYRYHGRVKALADSAREAGLKF